MTAPADSIADPRVYPAAAAAPEEAQALFARVESALAAATADRADRRNGEIRASLRAMVDRDASQLSEVLASAPSAPVARHLWRQLEFVWRDATRRSSGIAANLFAIPVVVVVALDRAGPAVTIPAVLNAHVLVDLLREGDALGGAQTFTLADALAASDAFALAQWPAIRAAIALPDDASRDAARPWSPPPSPIEVSATHESVHLRFLIGVAMTRADRDLAPPARVGAWGMPLARELARALTLPGVSVLALPRAPMALLPALRVGQLASREVAAQLFASNALRKLRAATGEPAAVISAHLAPDAIQGGELRLSLSSPFAPRDAEGFRCPLYPQDRVGDVAVMLADILRDCRVADIRVLPGVHPDRDPATGLPLLFKADGVDPPQAIRLH